MKIYIEQESLQKKRFMQKRKVKKKIQFYREKSTGRLKKGKLLGISVLMEKKKCLNKKHVMVFEQEDNQHNLHQIRRKTDLFCLSKHRNKQMKRDTKLNDRPGRATFRFKLNPT